MSTEQTTTQPEQTQTAPQAPAEQTTAVAKKEKYIPELCAATINKLPVQLQALKGCFAQPFGAFRKSFKDPEEADRVMAREISFAAQAMMANPYLIKCATSNPMSLVNALENVGQANSTLNPVLKQGYLVPFSGAIQFMPSYMGLVEILVSSGLVKKVEAHPVFKGEEFEIKHGSQEGIFHKPNPWGKRDKENLQGCYYFAVLVDGTEMFDTMSVEEIEKIRKRAPSAKASSPWDTDYIEMAKKTLIRRAFKAIAKRGLSDDKVKAVKAAFDYDEKAEQSWIDSQKSAPKRDSFDEEEADWEEV